MTVLQTYTQGREPIAEQCPECEATHFYQELPPDDDPTDIQLTLSCLSCDWKMNATYRNESDRYQTIQIVIRK